MLCIVNASPPTEPISTHYAVIADRNDNQSILTNHFDGNLVPTLATTTYLVGEEYHLGRT